MKKKFITDVLIYSVAPQIPRIANVLLLPLTTPFLTPIDFGVYGVVISYVLGFEVLKSLGLDIILMNSFFKEKDTFKNTWGKIQAIISSWSLVLAVLVGLIVYLILPPEVDAQNRWFIVFAVCFPSSLFAGLSKVSVLFYQYSQRPIPIVIRSAFLGILAVAINYYTIVELHLGYKGWFYSGLVVGIISPLSYIYPIWIKERILPVYRITMQELKKMLRISLPILPHHYASYFLNQSDRVIMSLTGVASSQIGIYNLGYSISSNFRFVTNGVAKVIAPTFHNMLLTENGPLSIKKIVSLLAVLYIFVGFIGGIWMREVFSLLIKNDELLQGYTVAIIVLFSFATRPLYNGAQSFLFFEERTSQLWRITFMFGMVNILLNVIFIPIYGIAAAAVNTFICIAGSDYGVFFLKDYKETTRVNFNPLRWFTVTIIVFSISWFLKDTDIIYKVIASIVSVGIALLVALHFKKPVVA